MTELLHTPVTSKEVAKYLLRDAIIPNVIKYVQNRWPSKTQDQFKPFHSCKNELSVENSCLLWESLVIIPFQLRDRVFNDLHGNHPGIAQMKALARSCVCLPGMDKFIEEKVQSCHSCQIHQHMPAAAPIHPWENATSPWVRVHLNFAGTFIGKMLSFFFLF